MKTIHQWLQEYGESHQNPRNIFIHKICVPLIMFTVLGICWSIPKASLFEGIWFINWSTLVAVLALSYYVFLSRKLALGMLFEVIIMFKILHLMELNMLFPIWATSLILFAIAWVFQFIGHNIEGKRPSFFKDLQFLLIGPLWTLNFFYKKWGIKV